jgi:hypothetical protein
MVKELIMKKTLLVTCLGLFAFGSAFSQTNPDARAIDLSVFERLTNEVKNYKPDTSAVPDDKITRKIIEVRTLKGGFNINEAVAYKIEEERKKNDMPKEELDKIATFFKSGKGKRWLDNAVIWIYRQRFTYKELKQLARFYKTPAGKKMGADLPVIMLQSLAAGEMIKGMYTDK